MRTIGLIGGMSWESTRIYYELLNRGVQQRLGALHSAQILLTLLDMARIATLQSQGRWDETGAWLALEAVRLERAGAEVIALATNTMHKCAPQITAAISHPSLHIVDPLVQKRASLDFGNGSVWEVDFPGGWLAVPSKPLDPGPGICTGAA